MHDELHIPVGQDHNSRDHSNWEDTIRKIIPDYSRDKLKSYAKYALLTIKTEIAISDIRQSLFWTSLLELGLLTASLVLLLFHGQFQVLIHLGHLVRPIFALRLIQHMPKSHEIYESLPENWMSESDQAADMIYTSIRFQTDDLSKYLIITVCCAALDLLGMLLDLGELSDTYTLYYSLVAWLFLALDSFIIFWYQTLQYSFPPEIFNNLNVIMRGTLEQSKGIVQQYAQNLRNS